MLIIMDYQKKTGGPPAAVRMAILLAEGKLIHRENKKITLTIVQVNM